MGIVRVDAHAKVIHSAACGSQGERPVASGDLNRGESFGHVNNFQEDGQICRSTMANMNPHRRQFLETATVATAVMSLPDKSGAEQSGLFPGFQTRRVATSGAEINLVAAGSGPPLLLLHGFPESHVSWHKIAPRLAERFTVVAPDLRGYGDSSKPADGENHANYSKRAMVLDQIEMNASRGGRNLHIGTSRTVIGRSYPCEPYTQPITPGLQTADPF